MNNLEKRLQLVTALFEDLQTSTKEHIKNERGPKDYWGWDKNHMNKNCGKVALKRKITYLRQELLNMGDIIECE